MKENIMAWTVERTNLLEQLWHEGLSASQIARKIDGVTRNAVIGKIHRLGISRRTKSSAPSNKDASVQVASGHSAARLATHHLSAGTRPLSLLPESGDASEPMLLLPSDTHTSVLQLNERICKWPIGDPSGPDFHFCGAEAKTNLPYCAAHAKIAYSPPERRRKRKRLGRVTRRR